MPRPMQDQTSESLSQQEGLSRARRRQASRRISQLRADAREAFLDDLAPQVTPGRRVRGCFYKGGGDEGESFVEDRPGRLTPGISFFLRAILAGLLVGSGYR